MWSAGNERNPEEKPMDAKSREELIDLRLEQIREGATEAISREVAWFKKHNFPVWVSENGHVVDAVLRERLVRDKRNPEA